MAIIGHVVKPGHRCRNPFTNHRRAEYVQMGKRMQYGAWELFYVPCNKVYVVCRANLTGDHYEFTNFNCAAAKLAELGKYYGRQQRRNI